MERPIKKLSTMSTSPRSLKKFKELGIEPSNDIEDFEGRVWVTEYDYRRNNKMGLVLKT